MPWPQATATGVGSMPGADPLEAANVVVGELPDLPHLPELPGRGLGADIIGRGAALLVDLPIEVVPSGYRTAAKPGHEHRRAVDLIKRDIDALEEAVERSGARPPAVKVQAAGPWTLSAGIELPRGHRVLTDRGALREFADSLAEGLTVHAAEISRRLETPVVVQLDEPSLPTILAGALSTPSGYGTVPAVAEPDARDLLAGVITTVSEATGQPVIVHCCAPRPPIGLFRAAGAQALALDATLLGGIPASLTDELGEAWDAGMTMLLGLVPATAPPTLAEAAKPALEVVDRLGFPRSILAERAVPTPTCGLAGADAEWARRALALVRDVGKAFVEPPESW
ncbi:methionine synthase [Kibdelosporangium phytohabitans]|uniref:Methionine synthase n=1 Tax=Kibdelosporangium phytohabitans TaxID=860235 RepID=A0A0N9IKG5_9PSEU|nr:methionine synthase [Kibdelosporangium phytohabitans]ALG15563.1 methionine synthase [Kibdelosporangium phytohabitans]